MEQHRPGGRLARRTDGSTPGPATRPAPEAARAPAQLTRSWRRCAAAATSARPRRSGSVSADCWLRRARARPAGIGLGSPARCVRPAGPPHSAGSRTRSAARRLHRRRATASTATCAVRFRSGRAPDRPAGRPGTRRTILRPAAREPVAVVDHQRAAAARVTAATSGDQARSRVSPISARCRVGHQRSAQSSWASVEPGPDAARRRFVDRRPRASRRRARPPPGRAGRPATPQQMIITGPVRTSTASAARWSSARTGRPTGPAAQPTRAGSRSGRGRRSTPHSPIGSRRRRSDRPDCPSSRPSPGADVDHRVDLRLRVEQPATSFGDQAACRRPPSGSARRDGGRRQKPVRAVGRFDPGVEPGPPRASGSMAPWCPTTRPARSAAPPCRGCPRCPRCRNGWPPSRPAG